MSATGHKRSRAERDNTPALRRDAPRPRETSSKNTAGRASAADDRRDLARRGRLTVTVDQIPSAAIVVDATGRVVRMNAAARQLCGGLPDPARALDDLIAGEGLRDRQTGQPLTPDDTPWGRAVQGHATPGRDLLYRGRGGDATEDRWLHASAAPLCDDEGRIVGAITTIVDVTAAGRPARASNPSDERLRAIYAALACGVVVLTGIGAVVDANAAAQRILGRDLEALRREGLADLRLCTARGAGGAGWDGGDGSTLLPASDERAIRVARRAGRPLRAAEVTFMRPDGERRWLHLDAVPLREDEEEHLVLSFIDVTARVRAEAALRHQALHDALTGLPNRTLLRDRLAQALRARRRDRGAVALLLLDLDHFKEVNDRYGHDGGDHLLRDVGARLRGALRAADTVARLGGDEFAVLLPGDDRVGALQAARTILAALASPLTLAGETVVVVEASVGIALAPAHGADATALLRCADVAMYTAKRAGGGYAVYEATQGPCP